MKKVEGHPPSPSHRRHLLAAMRHLLHPHRWIYRSLQDRGSGAAGAPPPPGASSIGLRSSTLRGARARACPAAGRQGGAPQLAPPWPPPRGLRVDPERERKAAMYRERRRLGCRAGDRVASRQQRLGRRGVWRREGGVSDVGKSKRGGGRTERDPQRVLRAGSHFFYRAPDKPRMAKACMLFKSLLRGLCHAQWRKKHGFVVCDWARQMFCLL
jgi:hypothetical protein